MKKISFILCLLYILSFEGNALAPQTFNYQAIARDQNGNLWSNKSLTLRIGILEDGWGSNYLELNAHVTEAGTLTELSDLNMKTNITQVTNSIDKIRQINGVSFQWKDQSMKKGAEPE
jgi:hypothetical protein